eukprot:2618409-Amphidinium_carterae.1
MNNSKPASNKSLTLSLSVWRTVSISALALHLSLVDEIYGLSKHICTSNAPVLLATFVRDCLGNRLGIIRNTLPKVSCTVTNVQSCSSCSQMHVATDSEETEREDLRRLLACAQDFYSAVLCGTAVQSAPIIEWPHGCN